MSKMSYGKLLSASVNTWLNEFLSLALIFKSLLMVEFHLWLLQRFDDDFDREEIQLLWVP